jgi:hypothetical protein
VENDLNERAQAAAWLTDGWRRTRQTWAGKRHCPSEESSVPARRLAREEVRIQQSPLGPPRHLLRVILIALSVPLERPLSSRPPNLIMCTNVLTSEPS